MRRVAIAVVLAIAVAALGIYFATRTPTSDGAKEGAPSTTTSTTSRPEVAPAPSGSRVVRGRVTSGGAGIAGVIVRASDPGAEASFAHRPCSCADHCGNELLKCGCQDSATALVEAAKSHAGEEPLLALATSGADGAFELDGLPARPLTLWAEQAGVAVARPVELEANATQVELTLGRGLAIVGKVQAGREGLGGVTVSAILRDHPRWFEATTAEQGAYRFDHLPPGAYVVVAAREGRLPGLMFAGDGSTGETWLTLEPPQTVVGVVLLDGAPARGVTVTLTGQHQHREAVSDGDGQVRFEGLERQSHHLDAESRGLRASEESNPLSPRPVELWLSQTGTLSGTVTLDGGAVAGAEVYTWLGMLRQQANTDATGHYQLDGLMPGTHRVGAIFEKVNGADEQQLSIKAGPNHASFELKPLAVISGQVVDVRGQPIEKAMVQLFIGPIMAGIDITGRDGTFAMPADGDRELTVVSGAWRHTMQVHAPAHDVRVQLGGGTTLLVKVSDTLGARVEGAFVRLTPKGFKPQSMGPFMSTSAVVAEGVTGGDGVAQLEGIDDGEYVVDAQAPPKGTGIDAKPVEVALAGRAATVELVVERGLPLDGRVESGEHLPVAGAVVSVSKVGGGGSSEISSANDGTFRFSGLAPGGYRVQATKPGFFSHSPWVDAQAGAREVKLELAPGRKVRGRVRGDGRPVRAFEINGHEVANEKGEFEVVVQDENPVELEVTAPGFRQLRKSVPLEPSEQLVPDLVLEHGRTLRVTVLDGVTGLPVADANVMVDMMQGETGATGRVVLEGLPDGELDVHVSTMDQVHAPAELKCSAAQKELTVKLGVPSGISGQVLDADGQPAPGERLSARASEGRMSWGSQSSADGTFKIAPLPAGHYSMTLDQEPHGSPAVEVDVAEGATVQVTLHKARLVAVHLSVTDSQHRTVSREYLVPGDVPLPANPSVLWSQPGPISLWDDQARVAPGHYTLMVVVGRPNDPGYGAFEVPVDLQLPSAQLEVQMPAQLKSYAR